MKQLEVLYTKKVTEDLNMLLLHNLFTVSYILKLAKMYSHISTKTTMFKRHLILIH